MSDELELVESFDRMNRVVEELLKGNNPSQISKVLGMSRSEVLQLLDTWRDLTQNDNSIRERAKQALTAADQHYSMIIKEAWDTVNEASVNSQLNIKAQALKLVADVEQKRMDMLSKAGVLEKNEFAEKILETEKKQEILVGILRDVTSKCDHCKHEVARRLADATKRVEIIQVD